MSDRITRPGWVEAILVGVAVTLLLLALTLGCGCAAVGKLASGVVEAASKCGRSPQVERAARLALDDDGAGAKLDELAESAGLEVVKCAVEWLLRSLTGAAQSDGELGAMSSDSKATREHLQPQVDRARAWLAKHKGERR